MPMSGDNLAGEPAELRMTISIKRARTGLVETYSVVGHATQEEVDELRRAGYAIDQPEEPKEK